MAQLATNAPAAGGFLDGLVEFFAAWRAKSRQYRVYRETLKELSALNDRELNDLGLSRAQIQATAWQCAYGK